MLGLVCVEHAGARPKETVPAEKAHTDEVLGSTERTTGRPEVAVAVGTYVPPTLASVGAVEVNKKLYCDVDSPVPGPYTSTE